MGTYDIYGVRYLFNALVNPPVKYLAREEKRGFVLNNKPLTITFLESRGMGTPFNYHIGSKVETGMNENVIISNSDFYELLVLNLNMYIQMGGLKGIPETR